MTTKVKIFNLTLNALGLARIASPTQSDDKAATLNHIYDDLLDEVLEAHPWNFARRRAALAAETKVPAFGFGLQYPFPTNPYCLRVWRLEDRTIKWVSEGRKILTDATAPLNVHFIARITDTSLFSGHFVTTLAQRMAAQSALRLTKSRSKEDKAWERYRQLRSEARSADAQEGTPEQDDGSDFLDSRS